ncbi:hypothetical protein DICPUDRAFT_79158 [Dictyostelium purpureum]|uniref:Peptidase C14 caspase domain-containing protein n=1 Tax=Dictyostelium purpureum TaxID=5786 RepID=F0ZLR2_DICPU|nr:uncharacterized protein DICPUDRAFT_79158 [Dictyostelium purpureum]EGC35114.1 hypothetical protein DICPUDRAFT_79158 [Dictyostelium purpureum]|eukprot:XP_003288366.1 hypothetical protein DICPUDRAFT_79158 [Dictyostelium purpureum]
MNNSSNNINIKRDISRHVPSEWDFFFDSDKEGETNTKQNIKNQKIRKAFVCGNSYGGKYHFDKDAQRVSDILQDKCGFNCTLVLNEPNLKKCFVEFINSFKYTETNVDLIFYFSGHTVSKKSGLELELDKSNETSPGCTSSKKKKSFLCLNELVDIVDLKEKDIEVSNLKVSDIQLSFKKLFILECCRLNDDATTDQYISILKKYPRPVESQFKESKNTAFLYSTNLGKYASERDPLSTFTESLVGRMTSKRAPGRDLNTVSEIIQEDLYSQYKKSNFLNPIDYNQQYKIWFSSLNMFSLDISGSGSTQEEKLASEFVHNLFEKFLKDKFYCFFGDTESMGKFVLVENEDPLEVKKKQKQQYLKNRRCASPSPSGSPLLKLPNGIDRGSPSPSGSPLIKSSSGVELNKSPSLFSGSNGMPPLCGNSPSSRCSSPSWAIGINISKSAPCIPLSQSPKLLVLGINKNTKFHINDVSQGSTDEDEELTNINGGGGGDSSSSLSPSLMGNMEKPINLLERIENQLSINSCGGSGGGYIGNDEEIDSSSNKNWRVFTQYNKIENTLI